MKTINPSSPWQQDIIVARCDNLVEASAMARWVLPVLEEWPQPAWHLWLADTTDCDAIKAAKMRSDADELEWRSVECDRDKLHDGLCGILGGHAGLVILGHHLVTAAAGRSLLGLVSRMSTFPATDPLAKSLIKPLASFGIELAA